MRIERLGSLRARIVGGEDGEGNGHGPLVVLLHGFGAPGDDLVPLARYLGADTGTRFVFPEAPLTLEMGFGDSRAWWMLDLDRLERDLATGRPRDRASEVPEGLAEARGAVLDLLDALDERFAPPSLVLGGFSQGSMLALDVALHDATRPLAGLVLLSGTLLAEHLWGPLMAARAGLRVFQSHGRRDPLLPWDAAIRLRDLLSQAGLDLHWTQFRGGHEIPLEVLRDLDAFLANPPQQS